MTKEERRIYNREWERKKRAEFGANYRQRTKDSESGISMACFAGSKRWIEEKFSQVPDYTEPKKKREKPAESFKPEAERQSYIASQCENLRKYGRL